MKHLTPLNNRNGITLILVAFILQAGAQDNTPNMAIKLYGNLSLLYDRFQTPADTAKGTTTVFINKTQNAGNITPGFAWFHQNGNFQEFELIRLSVYHSETALFTQNNQTGGLTNKNQTVNSSQFALVTRYEYNRQMGRKNENKKLTWYAGMAVRPFYTFYKFLPQSSNSFPEKSHAFGLSLAVVPRINYALSKKWFIDVNIPITLAENRNQALRVQNPAFTAQQQKSFTVNYTLFPSHFSGRFGISYRL